MSWTRRLPLVCRAARCIDAWRSWESALMSEPERRGDALGSVRRRSGFERRVVVRLIALEAVAIALGIWVLALSHPGWILWVAALAVLLMFLAAATAAVLKAVV